MNKNSKTTEVRFFCSKHGALIGKVEYFSANIGSEILTDIPVKYCEACNRYYTPFANLLAVYPLKYRGEKVMPSQGNAGKDIPKEKVRRPRFINAERSNLSNARAKSEDGIEISSHTQKTQNVRYPRYIEGYEIIQIGNRSMRQNDSVITVTSYPCDKCLKCNNSLVNGFVKTIRINEEEAARVPGKFCTKCNAFFEERGGALSRLLSKSSSQERIIIDDQFLLPQYSVKIREARSLPTASLAAHIMEKNSRRHRFITIVLNRSERHHESDVYHYSDHLARVILYSLFKNELLFIFDNEEYFLLKASQLYKSSKPILEQLAIETLAIEKGGGLYGRSLGSNIKLVDILLFSPYTKCFEICHASYNSDEDYYFVDISVFRKFIEQYGNPGVQIVTYQKDLRSVSALRDESFLHAYGYVVGKNGLSERSRQALLAEVLDLGLMTAACICSLLNTNIALHAGEKYDIARADWESDKQFVMEYKVDPKRFAISKIGL